MFVDKRTRQAMVFVCFPMRYTHQTDNNETGNGHQKRT